MPVEFLTDAQVAAYGRFAGSPSLVELERFCFLDDADLRLVDKRRADPLRLGFALQLVTARFVGRFLADPLDVPAVVLDYVAEQLQVADPSCVKGYLERRATRFEHQAEISKAGGYRDFASAEAELTGWVADRAWMTGDGPRALFDGAVGWLRKRRVLLPGESTLARLVARVRDGAEARLWDTLSGLLTADQSRLLEGLLEVPAAARFSPLEGWRRGPSKATGAAMVLALDRAAEVAGLRMGELDLAAVPHRRMVELARYGVAAKAPALRRHPQARRLATLLATVRWLEAKSVDDALELFDVLVTTELFGRAERQASAEKLARYPRIAKHAARLAAAVEVLLEAEEWGQGEEMTLEVVWDAIENVVSRAELRAAVAGVTEVLPPPDADPDGEWRARLMERFASIRGFAPLLCQVVEFGSTAEAAPVLAAMRDLPGLMETKASKKVPAGYLDARRVAVDLVPSGWWQRLVFPPGRPEGTVAKAAYVFCVLEAFHRRLKRRDIFATGVSDGLCTRGA